MRVLIGGIIWVRIFMSLTLWLVGSIDSNNGVNIFFFPYTKMYNHARDIGYSKVGSMILTIILFYFTFYVFLYELIAAIVVGVKRAFDFMFKERRDNDNQKCT